MKMAKTSSEALATSVPEMVQQDEVSSWARLAFGCLPAEPNRPVTEKELVTAIEKEQELDRASDLVGSQRGRALDQLLHVSFAPISPAYLFNSFPPLR